MLSRYTSILAVGMMTLLTADAPPPTSAHSVARLRPRPHPGWPMFGGSPSRNMVNTFETDIVETWSIDEAKPKNVVWSAKLGSRTIGSPVVANDRVFVATNNGFPHNPQAKGPRAVLSAYRESDGKHLWSLEHPFPKDFHNRQFSPACVLSTPTVVGNRLFVLTADSVLLCASTQTGRVVWRYDMRRHLNVFPCRSFCATSGPPTLSSPLVVGNLVFVSTGNGADETGTLPSPRAPSFVAIGRRTGKLMWKSNLPNQAIIEGQWSSPVFSKEGGRRQVIFAAGDGVLYSFEPGTGQLLWKCDCLPQRRRPHSKFSDPSFVGSPVVVGDRLYIGMGLSSGFRKPLGPSYFLCIDITKTGDVSPKSYDVRDPANKNSALVWAYGGLEPHGEKDDGDTRFGSTIATPAIHDGLVYITETNGYLHCLDSKSGKRVWRHDFLESVRGSPMWVDGRIYVGNEGGELLVFAHGRECKLLTTIDMRYSIDTTPIAVGGRLYIATDSTLYCLGAR